MTLKVIGAGLGRTGTLSLKQALETLGFGPCYHMMEVFKNPAAAGWWDAVADGAGPGWDAIFEGYASTVDWPSSTFYRELVAANPTAKVILTERDPDEWFTSTQATIFNRDYTAEPTNMFESMARKVIGRMFDMRMHDRDWVIGKFLEHNAEVRRVIPADRLLVYFAADGWGPLCDFLGVAPPADAMPNVNSTREFQARVARA
jgi:hypothetical protein